MNGKLPKVIVVAGVTASGKSDFAAELALKCNGEIISADSRQVYKDLDIGTGKITEKEMRDVPHHMLSVYDLDEEVSVARFARDASPIVRDILTRGKTPIICGGTGQYIDALIFDTPIPEVPPDQILRNELEALDTESLVERLRTADPDRLAAIDAHNRVRLIRALEITTHVGKVPPLPKPHFVYDVDFYLMHIERTYLKTRVEKRLEKRLGLGMIEEVQQIMKRGYSHEAMKKFGLEYVCIGKYLEGRLTLEEMKEDLIRMTMRYAKRQVTWNKKYLPYAQIIEVTH